MGENICILTFMSNTRKNIQKLVPTLYAWCLIKSSLTQFQIKNLSFKFSLKPYLEFNVEHWRIVCEHYFLAVGFSLLRRHWTIGHKVYSFLLRFRIFNIWSKFFLIFQNINLWYWVGWTLLSSNTTIKIIVTN